jgi:hypothetical protein
VPINIRQPSLRVPGHAQASLGDRLEINPCAPFRLELTAWALRRRSHNAVDRWSASTYQRVVSIEGGPLALSVAQDGGLDAPRLEVVLSGRPIDQRAELLARGALNRLLGLTVDLSDFTAMAKRDPLLSVAPPAALLGGVSVEDRPRALC